MVETVEKAIIPENFLIKIGIDTSTLVRLFRGSWKTAEMALYQNFFKIKIAPTVYEEFLNFQDTEKWLKLSVKKKFLSKVLSAKVVLPESIEADDEAKSADAQICEEYSEMDVDFVLTDDEDFEELTDYLGEIEVLNAKHIWWKFGEYKK